ncbi:3-deoxy-manno-octulosonate cytidylyltransferase [Burkholderia thailandensis]|nr:3-deoxy-manno-octulosonate cytidylyltransferase [Burkholderia thailandensis]AVR24089.1 3-deoxy-manno-octulosonate cytidylyltransferase [Burkholderia thailandensis]AWY57419.1 3-deoxy-manno-octulosonate cytidylyltransferase [Burkholderia thailandensis]AWY68425.1 3-deoxy-manno-octulosonate cytidylyltransferase [Burkholderia thailandensis]MDD1482775.1 3-deoxy-manno-octulosonate cytidylyltransferase [Burkholderia thailandensis]
MCERSARAAHRDSPQARHSPAAARRIRPAAVRPADRACCRTAEPRSGSRSVSHQSIHIPEISPCV